MLISQYTLVNSTNNFEKKKNNDAVKPSFSSNRAASDNMDKFNKRTPKFGMDQLKKASRLREACKNDSAYNKLDEKYQQIQAQFNRTKTELATFLKHTPQVTTHSDIKAIFSTATLDNENVFDVYSLLIQREPNLAAERPKLQQLNNEGNRLRQSLEEIRQQLKTRETEISNSLH